MLCLRRQPWMRSALFLLDVVRQQADAVLHGHVGGHFKSRFEDAVAAFFSCTQGLGEAACGMLGNSQAPRGKKLLKSSSTACRRRRMFAIAARCKMFRSLCWQASSQSPYNILQAWSSGKLFMVQQFQDQWPCGRRWKFVFSKM